MGDDQPAQQGRDGHAAHQVGEGDRGQGEAGRQGPQGGQGQGEGEEQDGGDAHGAGGLPKEGAPGDDQHHQAQEGGGHPVGQGAPGPRGAVGRRQVPAEALGPRRAAEAGLGEPDVAAHRHQQDP